MQFLNDNIESSKSYSLSEDLVITLVTDLQYAIDCMSVCLFISKHGLCVCIHM